ncbi:unnamed protein product [Leuciscus chuanchicus]
MADSERYSWTDDETRYFLHLIEENDITCIFDGKRQRNATTFQELQRKMAINGYTKPWHILRSKWKVLKQRYLVEKRDLSRSGSGGKKRTKFTFFSEMDHILGQRPIVSSFSTNINSSETSELCEQQGNEDDYSVSTDRPPNDSLTPSDSGPVTDSNTESPSLDQPDETVQQDSDPPPNASRWRRSHQHAPKRKQLAELKAIFHDFLDQQREQAERDQQVTQSIASVISQAVQCFERCANAAERHAHASEVMAGLRQPTQLL